MTNYSKTKQERFWKLWRASGAVAKDNPSAIPATRSAFQMHRNVHLVGTGNYCPDCGGLCGNSNHDRRRW